MPAPLLLDPIIRHWECPRCNLRATTRQAQPHTEFHACSGLGGLNAPMVEQGSRANVAVEVREDYVGDEDVQYDGDGRPVMSIRTTRDGEDLAVYAPTAHMGGSA